MERFGLVRFFASTHLSTKTTAPITLNPLPYGAGMTSFLDGVTGGNNSIAVVEQNIGDVARAHVEHPDDLMSPVVYGVAGAILLLALRMFWYFLCRKRNRYAVESSELVSFRTNNDECQAILPPPAREECIITLTPPAPPLPPPIIPHIVPAEVLLDGRERLMADIRDIYKKRYPNGDTNISQLI